MGDSRICHRRSVGRLRPSRAAKWCAVQRGNDGANGPTLAPSRITGHGHQRPRLYRLNSLPDHHWVLDIPGVWGGWTLGISNTQ
jgi:hypothetical protein